MDKNTKIFELIDETDSTLLYLSIVKDLINEIFKDFASDFDLNDKLDRQEGDHLLKFRVPIIRSLLFVSEEYINKTIDTLTNVVEQSCQLHSS